MPPALDPFQLVPRPPNEDRIPEQALRDLAISNLVQISDSTLASRTCCLAYV